MTKRNHVVGEVLAEIRPEWGPVEAIITTANNRAVALWCRGHEAQRLVFRGQVLGTANPDTIDLKWSLSVDGSKLAVASRVFDGGEPYYDVTVNGEPAYRTERGFTMHHFDWLDSQRLAWDGWFEKEDEPAPEEENEDRPVIGTRQRRLGRICYFQNGEEIPGFSYEPVWAERMHLALLVQEDGLRYTRHDDGSRSRERPACCDSLHCRCRLDRDEPRAAEEFPEIKMGPDRLQHVSYRGQTGEGFEEIVSTALHHYCFNTDASRVAYIGMRHTGVSKLVGQASDRLIEASLSEDGMPAWWSRPLLLLFVPDFGIGHAWLESGKRYYPVNHDRAWRKGYRGVGDRFFTPRGELVVQAVTANDKMRVVIDEDEGPAFDRIENVRYHPAEAALSYIARDGDKIYRVTVADL